VLTAAGDSKGACNISVVTDLSMGLPSLMNGLRLARYYGHSAQVVLSRPPGRGDERAMELAYAEKKLRAQSVDVIYGLDAPEGRIKKDYIKG